MVKPQQRISRDALIVAAALAIGAAVAVGPDVVAADKSKRDRSSDSSSSSSSSRRASSSNNSIRTQELAGDALAEKLGSSKPTSRPSDSPADLRSRLSDVQDDINAEDDRHASAVASLRKSKANKKALDKENATYEQRRAALDEQRRSLIARLNDDDGKATDATTEPAAPAPAAKKPAKSSNARKR